MRFLNKILKRGEKRATKAKEVAIRSEEGTAVEDKSAARSGKIIVGVIRATHVTEKASAMAKSRQYVFRVTAYANKPQVKQAVESRYGVNVEAVRMVNVPGKERRRGRQIGWKQGYKKAVVTVEKGQSIEIQ